MHTAYTFGVQHIKLYYIWSLPTSEETKSVALKGHQTNTQNTQQKRKLQIQLLFTLTASSKYADDLNGRYIKLLLSLKLVTEQISRTIGQFHCYVALLRSRNVSYLTKLSVLCQNRSKLHSLDSCIIILLPNST